MEKKFIKIMQVLFISLCIIITNINLNAYAQESNPKISYKTNGSTNVNSVYEIDINVSNIKNLYGFSLDFVYDNSMIEIIEMRKGDIFNNTNAKDIINKKTNKEANLAILLLGSSSAITKESGTLATIKVKALKQGELNLKTVSDNSYLDMIAKNIRIKLSNPNANSIKYSVDESYSIIQKNMLQPMLGFSVSNVNSKSTEINGTGVSGAKVSAYVGGKRIGSEVTVNSSGKYKITIPMQKANTSIVVKTTKADYEAAEKAVKVIGIVSGAKGTLTKDIYRYDAGKGKYLTFINGKGYSQYSYLNKGKDYAFTPSSWMIAAGLTVSMPSSSNGYTMTVDNNYIDMYNDAKAILDKVKSGKVSSQQAVYELNNMHLRENNLSNLSKAAPSQKLTTDIYRYDVGKGKHITYINGKAYSQYAYLNRGGDYAFTPSSWMVAAGLTVTMPTTSNGYTMKITNPYITKYNDTVKEIKSYI